MPPPCRPALPHPASRHRFTLIELLICVVIIGVLAAVSIPKFANTKGKATLANMRSDMHNLIVAEEGYYNEHHAYAGDLALLDARTSPGVDVTILTATPTGWSARSEHPASSPVRCAVFYGAAAAVALATAEGVVTCR